METSHTNIAELKALVREHISRHNRVPAGPVEALLRYVEEMEAAIRVASQVVTDGGDGAIVDTIWVRDGMTLVDLLEGVGT